jgi:hypothetical protein
MPADRCIIEPVERYYINLDSRGKVENANDIRKAMGIRE